MATVVVDTEEVEVEATEVAEVVEVVELSAGSGKTRLFTDRLSVREPPQFSNELPEHCMPHLSPVSSVVLDAPFCIL